ncbi:MAG: tetratricopeptide repeat protein [bacterium]
MALSKSGTKKSFEKIIDQRLPIAERIELKEFCHKLPKLLTRPRFFIFFVNNKETKQVIQGYLQNEIPEYLSEYSITINPQNIEFLLYLKSEKTAKRIIPTPQKFIQVDTLNIDTIEQRKKLYHDLNLRREWIEQMGFSLLFWFHENQRNEIFTHASDFWQFRGHSLTFGLYEDFLKTKPDYTAIKKEIKDLQKKVEKFKDSSDTASLINYLEEYAIKLYDFGNYREAEKSMKQLLKYTDNFNDTKTQARALNNIGVVEQSLGNYESALKYYRQALELCRELGDRSGEASALNNIGNVEQSLGNYQTALKYHRQALERYRELGDRSGEAHALNNIGVVEQSLGNYQSVRKYYQQALERYRELGDRSGEASALNNIGRVEQSLNNNQSALKYYQQSLGLFRELGEKHSEAKVMEDISKIYTKLGKNDKANELSKKADDIKIKLGIKK